MRLGSRQIAAAVAVGALGAPAAAHAADATVSFRCCDYTPRRVTIAPGETITWLAEAGHDFDASTSGPTHHPLKFVNDAQPAQTSGTTATRTFTKSGTFRYFCTFHGTADGQGMAGTVTVESAPATGNGPAPAPAPGPAFGETQPESDSGPPEVWTGLPRDRSLRTLGRRGLKLTLGASKAGSATTTLRHRGRTIGRARVTLTTAGERQTTIKLTRTGRRSIRGLRRARLHVVVVFADRIGNEVEARRSLAAHG